MIIPSPYYPSISSHGKKKTPDRRLPSPEKEDWRWMVTYYSRLHDKFTDLLTWSPIWRSASFSSLLWFFYSFQNTATMSSLSSSTSSTVCKIAYWKFKIEFLFWIGLNLFFLLLPLGNFDQFWNGTTFDLWFHGLILIFVYILPIFVMFQFLV